MISVAWLHRLRLPLTALGGGVLGVLMVLLYLSLDPPAGRLSEADIARVAQARIDAITPAPPVEPAIYAALRPSVVTITKTADGPGRGRDVGSGVVIDRDGSILTAFHVVAGTESVTVRFHDGSTTTGTVSQEVPERDLAVVAVGRLPAGVEPAVLSGGIRQGDPVLAIGAPFGLEGSVSRGVVSALGRTFVVEKTGQVLEDMIQFDAAVNPGSSGGPLVDGNGRVVGIVSGIINPTSDSVFVGLGFAVPIESGGGILAPFD